MGSIPHTVPDNVLPNDSSMFPSTSQLPLLPRGNTDGPPQWGDEKKGNDSGSKSGKGSSTNQSDEDESEDFVAYEDEPRFDLADLQHRVQYPDIARRNGIEGKVVVRVRISEDGTPTKSTVEYSDNQLLNEAAVKAVMATVFTPALQNKHPLAVWISIPINFDLH